MEPFVDFSTYNASNPFGAVDPVLYPSTHHHIGSDFKVPVGTAIHAPEDGELVKVLFNKARGNTAIYIFHHGVDWGVEFCHLEELPTLGKFTRGQIVGYTGNTGTATTAPHLHVTLHKYGLVSKDYEQLISEAAFIAMRDSGQLQDPYKWFTEHRG